MTGAEGLLTIDYAPNTPSFLSVRWPSLIGKLYAYVVQCHIHFITQTLVTRFSVYGVDPDKSIPNFETIFHVRGLIRCQQVSLFIS